MASRQAALAWVSLSVGALLYSMVWAADGPSIPVSYCSSANTADADMTPFFYTWQSEGRCYDNCTSHNFAFGIIQNKYCWCSNLIPNKADQKPIGNCEFPCPGYPTDFCGGTDLFGYIEAAGNTPQGTAPAGGGDGGGKSSSSTTGSPPDSDVTTITVGGSIRTITAPSEPTAPGDNNNVENKDSGLTGGAIAGVVIGVLGAIAIIAALIWFLFVKRRRDRDDADPAGLGSPGRGASPGRIATPGSAEMSESRYGGSTTGGPSDKRRSHLMPVDPRLDPFTTGMYPSDHNRSRESFNSLQDNQDYSRRVHQPGRVLRAMNPDPDV
ncbi:uncharacterized protein C8A04DRAFT_37527 [Dichotomopilus funicola]|uniref:WSC domain-containing protein n=1 Tax=Dichotomopilus funicola TaxID=1934379 RepID=A0AAN6ZLX5_9PEZI|nr:hypothetical protein C8A04DRAFT_37527 [Dichotomopilus funicola]